MNEREISPAEAARRTQDGSGVVLVDCREADELQLAKIGRAIHVPLSDFVQRAATLDPSGSYVVYCHHGVRSRRAADYLRSIGFTRVLSMSGGIDAWSREVDSSVPRYS